MTSRATGCSWFITRASPKQRGAQCSGLVVGKATKKPERKNCANRGPYADE